MLKMTPAVCCRKNLAVWPSSGADSNGCRETVSQLGIISLAGARFLDIAGSAVQVPPAADPTVTCPPAYRCRNGG